MCLPTQNDSIIYEPPLLKDSTRRKSLIQVIKSWFTRKKNNNYTSTYESNYPYYDVFEREPYEYKDL